MTSQLETPSVLHSVADLLTKQVTTDQLLRAMVDRVVQELSAERLLGIGRNTLLRKLEDAG